MEWHIEKPTKDIYGIVTESNGYVESATYDVDRDKWETCDIYESYTIDNVIAWMPMPEPYKPDIKDGESNG